MAGQGRTYDDIAKEEDTKVAEGREAEGLVRVEGRAGRADHIYSMRFTPEEIALIRQQAEARGVKVSQFIREAVLASARRPDDRSEAVRELHAKVQDLAQAVERLS